MVVHSMRQESGKPASGCIGNPSAPACVINEPLTGNYFVSTYPPFSVWRRDAVGAVHQILEEASAAGVPFGIYVHIPFCEKRCDYCYYLSYADRSDEEMDAYVARLIRELAMYREARLVAERRLDFVYLGGGTPSLLSSSNLARLLEGLQAEIPWTGCREATVECAPRSVTPSKLRVLRDAGVTRVSLGVQQLNDDLLRANGRIHRVTDVIRAYEAIRAAAFPIVNLDLIVGMVGETDDNFDRGLEDVLAMAPDSVTIYQLEIPFHTPLARSIRDRTLEDPMPDWDIKHNRLGRAFARLERAGYAVRSAYAAVRDAQRHPFIYQDEQYRGADLLGIGAASFSYLAGVHSQNLGSLNEYAAAVDAGQLPLGRAHRLSAEERLVREFVLHLKLGHAEAAYFRQKFGADIAARFAEPLGRLVECGWCEVGAKGVVLTREGLLRIDRLLPAFYRPEHRGIRYT